MIIPTKFSQNLYKGKEDMIMFAGGGQKVIAKAFPVQSTILLEMTLRQA